MKTSFLEYYKNILEKVSFDFELFTKEYDKAVRTLNRKERDELNRWLMDKNNIKVNSAVEQKQEAA